MHPHPFLVPLPRLACLEHAGLSRDRDRATASGKWRCLPTAISGQAESEAASLYTGDGAPIAPSVSVMESPCPDGVNQSRGVLAYLCAPRSISIKEGSHEKATSPQESTEARSVMERRGKASPVLASNRSSQQAPRIRLTDIAPLRLFPRRQGACHPLRAVTGVIKLQGTDPARLKMRTSPDQRGQDVEREGRGSVTRMTAVALHCTERVEDWFVGAVGKGHINDPATIGDGKRLIAVAVAASEEADNRQAIAMNMMRATTDLRTTAEHLARIGIDVVCRSRTGRMYVRQRARCVNRPDGPDPLEAA